MEEWNEYGELQQNIGDVPTTSTSVTSTPAKPGFGSPAGSASGTPSKLTIGTPQSNASSPAAEREMAERQKETASIGSIRNNPFMKQLAGEAAGVAKGRTFGKPKPTPKEPLQDTTNVTPQTSAPEKSVSPPSTTSSTAPIAPVASDNASTTATASSSDAAITSPRSTHSRHSSTSSRHASFIPEHPSPAPLQHRGSEISLASEEEIKEIEKATAIPEEDEGDDGGACLPTSTSATAKATEAINSVDGAADEQPAQAQQPDPAELEEFAKKLDRVGTDLSLMEDEQGVTSPTIAEKSMQEEHHADTPAATSPIEKFEASLGRTGTDLSLMEESHGLDAEKVTEEELKGEKHADTPAATSPIEKFEASLSRSGTGLDDVEKAHGLSSEDVLEEELKHETSIPAEEARVEEMERLEATLDRTGTDLQAEKEHGVDAEKAMEGGIKKEEHVPLGDVEEKVKETKVQGDVKEGEKEGESAEH